ncbi:hypothetical protein BDN72DRAFT_880510 [Pluteus cervinus]|uniref:Uncharacterized protein n=1 Tax=Pluteus cervinus TaxID=181527 RepID=A0ACD3AKG2_9AGAR|nr:hypothetical protein BDN72DRAFT_880510 [Pluteus cervinus]
MTTAASTTEYPAKEALTLPLDVIHHIVQNFLPDETQALANLTLTSRDFHELSLRQLYSTCSPGYERPNIKLFFRTITSSPRHASLVKDFSFMDISQEEDSDGFWDLVVSGLRCMINTIKLQFLFLYLAPMANVVLSGCTFPNLRTLEWMAADDTDDELLRFYQRHPKLSALRLNWICTRYTDEFYRRLNAVVPDVFPSLEYLVADEWRLSLILPGRNVWRVCWSPTWRALSPELLSAFKNVRWMWIEIVDDDNPRQISLLDLAVSLENLEVFRLGRYTGQDDLEEFVTRLPRLRRLMFFYRNSTIKRARRKAIKLFSAGNKDLENIDIAIKSCDDLFHRFRLAIPQNCRGPGAEVDVVEDGEYEVEHHWMESV